jgi:hypothetical protein
VGARGVQAERALVRAMLLSRDSAEEIVEAIGRLDDEAIAGGSSLPTIRDPALAAIARALLDRGLDASPAELSEHLSVDAVELLEALLAEQDSVVNLPATISDSLLRLRERQHEERIARLRSGPADLDAVNAEVLRLKKENQEARRRPSPRTPH